MVSKARTDFIVQVQKRPVLLTVVLPNSGGEDKEGFADFYNSLLCWPRPAFTTVVVGARIELEGGHSSNKLYRTQPALGKLSRKQNQLRFGHCPKGGGV